MKIEYCLLLALWIVSPLASGQTGPHIPDGMLSESELRQYTRLGKNGENELLLQNSEEYLRVAVKSEELYVASLCLCVENKIYVLHASAALGMVTYTKDENGKWPTVAEFEFAMRDTDISEASMAKRRNYLEENGWIANTMEMGKTGETEFLIAKERFADSGQKMKLALGLMPASDAEQIIDLPKDQAPGCANKSLVGGYLENEYGFQPEQWFSLELN